MGEQAGLAKLIGLAGETNVQVKFTLVHNFCPSLYHLAVCLIAHCQVTATGMTYGLITSSTSAAMLLAIYPELCSAAILLCVLI